MSGVRYLDKEYTPYLNIRTSQLLAQCPHSQEREGSGLQKRWSRKLQITIFCFTRLTTEKMVAWGFVLMLLSEMAKEAWAQGCDSF